MEKELFFLKNLSNNHFLDGCVLNLNPLPTEDTKR